jgi:hypothetical protein
MSSHYRAIAVDPEVAMPTPPRRNVSADAVPFGQRLFDNMYLLLAAGLVVMLVLYTAWGLWEIHSLPPATLP